MSRETAPRWVRRWRSAAHLDEDGPMGCTSWVDEMTSIAAGRQPSIEPALLENHVQRCDSCREYHHSIRHDAQVPAATPQAVASSIRQAARREDQDQHSRILRLVLVGLGVQIIVLAAPSLLFLDTDIASPHDARHIGAFATAFGVGLLLVARRPARARTMLTVGQVLVAALVLSAIVDVLDQTVSITNEFLHLPEVLAVGVLWMMSNANSSARPISTPART